MRHAARLDERLRSITQERDDIRARVNAISKEVGALRRAGDLDAAEQLQDESRALGETERALAVEHDEVDATLRDLLLGIPNLPHPDAPDGAGEEDNPVVTGPIGLLETYPDHQRVPHWETAAALGILDNERAAKISGAMFTMQRGAGATLSRALCQYGLDLNADAFEEIRPPSLVSTATLTATGQLPKFADDAYSIERDDLWCIPTAEVPLTSIYAGETLDDLELPIRVMAYSASYRREAGSAGRDTRGMLRSHEFDKVEILAFATPEQAPDLLVDMTGRAERAIAGLGPAVPGDRDLHRRHGPEPPPQLRHRGVRPGRRRVAGGVVDQLVQRLPGPSRQHPLPPSRRGRQAAQGHRVRPHAERIGARRAPGVGGDHRELPQRRRLGRPCPTCCTRTCGASPASKRPDRNA